MNAEPEVDPLVLAEVGLPRPRAWLLPAAGVIVAATWIGMLLAPTLAKDHPLWLIALNPWPRHQLLVAPHSPPIPFRSDASLSRVPAPLRRSALRVVELATYDWGLDLSAFGVPVDPFGSAMVTNVGMFGLPHAFAPLVPFARVPIVLTVGALRDAALVDGGALVVRPVLPVGVTLDHRLIDGFQAGKLARRFEAVMCDPAVALGAAARVD